MNKEKFSESYSKWAPNKKPIRGREISGDTSNKPTSDLDIKQKRSEKREANT
jgi:hypothetical protein